MQSSWVENEINQPQRRKVANLRDQMRVQLYCSFLMPWNDVLVAGELVGKLVLVRSGRHVDRLIRNHVLRKVLEWISDATLGQ